MQKVRETLKKKSASISREVVHRILDHHRFRPRWSGGAVHRSIRPGRVPRQAALALAALHDAETAQGCRIGRREITSDFWRRRPALTGWLLMFRVVRYQPDVSRTFEIRLRQHWFADVSLD